MPKPVLQTKMIGYQTDETGHVMAPPEVVYVCEEPPQQPIRSAISFMLGVVTVALALFGLIAGPLELFGVDVPSLFDLFGA